MSLKSIVVIAIAILILYAVVGLLLRIAWTILPAVVVIALIVFIVKQVQGDNNKNNGNGL